MERKLAEIAKKVRQITFATLVQARGGHFGGCLSMAEILTVLYFDELKINPKQPKDPRRDFFILSKGHAGPALYATLALRGYYNLKELEGLDKPLSKFPKHVDRLKLPGIEASTGSLGQGLSISCGIALRLKTIGKKNRIYVVVGDGECNEGQVWEAIMLAAKYKLDNLCMIVDMNNCQIDGTCDEVMPIESLDKKFEAFGWKVMQINGHDVLALQQGFAWSRSIKGFPSALIANTIKGYGVSFMENKPEWHSGTLTKEQEKQGFKELGVL